MVAPHSHQQPPFRWTLHLVLVLVQQWSLTNEHSLLVLNREMNTSVPCHLLPRPLSTPTTRAVIHIAFEDPCWVTFHVILQTHLSIQHKYTAVCIYTTVLKTAISSTQKAGVMEHSAYITLMQHQAFRFFLGGYLTQAGKTK